MFDVFISIASYFVTYGSLLIIPLDNKKFSILVLYSYASSFLFKKLKEIPAIIGLNIVSVLRQIFEDVMAERRKRKKK